ncbi:13856_t:CDS:2, partial [Racocetra fulgida]
YNDSFEMFDNSVTYIDDLSEDFQYTKEVVNNFHDNYSECSSSMHNYLDNNLLNNKQDDEIYLMTGQLRVNEIIHSIFSIEYPPTSENALLDQKCPYDNYNCDGQFIVKKKAKLNLNSKDNWFVGCTKWQLKSKGLNFFYYLNYEIDLLLLKKLFKEKGKEKQTTTNIIQSQTKTKKVKIENESITNSSNITEANLDEKE